MSIDIQLDHLFGPIGRALRLIIGLLLILVVANDVFSANHSDTVSTYFLALACFVGLLIIYSAAYLLLAPTFVGNNGFLATLVFVMPTMFLLIAPNISSNLQVGNWIGYTELNHPFMLALLLYLGISFLFQWYTKCGGCEAIAIQNAIFGKPFSSYCVPLLPFDLIEKKLSK